MKKKYNRYIIDFRYELIDLLISDEDYNGNSMTKEKKDFVESILSRFNNHFGHKYELG